MLSAYNTKIKRPPRRTRDAKHLEKYKFKTTLRSSAGGNIRWTKMAPAVCGTLTVLYHRKTHVSTPILTKPYLSYCLVTETGGIDADSGAHCGSYNA